ncbi:CbrC family protein [Deinococcus aquaedulcis]|uniref:CbrC family protein n=1 Tax=Deinococcus aquaedulcis TaxID=2840455 RepID=UPI001C83CBFA|nr:CbrC family protein [Deinococcus aquaedulcis]
MSEALPFFRYHPDPLATGMIEPFEGECPCCAQVRGYRYTSIPFAEDEWPDLCPWCIADGSAHERLEAEFTDSHGVGGGSWAPLPDEVRQVIVTRTPGFSGWQQERWWTHCSDGAAFLGRAGAEELAQYPEFAQMLREQLTLPEGEWVRFAQTLNRAGSPTAYLFQCLHCGAYGGYTDAD